ncbi:MAG: hypothetical protein V3U60_02430 [Gammaproteobacteria bacterium]
MPPLFIAMPRKAYEWRYRGEPSVGAFEWDGSGGSFGEGGEVCVSGAVSVMGQGAGGGVWRPGYLALADGVLNVVPWIVANETHSYYGFLLQTT